MGKLAVIVGGEEVWSREGEQGPSWIHETVDLSSRAGQTISIQFVGIRASSFTGDAAIDDIAFIQSDAAPEPDQGTTDPDHLSLQMVMACPGPSPAAKTTQCMSESMYEDIVIQINDIMKALQVNHICENNNCKFADFVGCTLRAAGHDFMDFRNGKGGSDGCLRFDDPDNMGLINCLRGDFDKSKISVAKGGDKDLDSFDKTLHDVYKNFCTSVSLADFMVIAGQAVMGFAATSTTKNVTKLFKEGFRYGRSTSETCRDAVHLPNPADGCRANEVTFLADDAFGLTWRETAALMGVHTVGKASHENSGYSGWWQDEVHNGKFDNHYYIGMVNHGWGPRVKKSGKAQWDRVDTSHEGGQESHPEMMLNTDLCLVYQDIMAESSDCCAWERSVPLKMMGIEEIDQLVGLGRDDFGKTFCGFASENASFSIERHWCCKSTPNDCAKIETALPPIFMRDPHLNLVTDGPATDDVHEFAGDEDVWLDEFTSVWKKVTEKGAGSLKRFENSCNDVVQTVKPTEAPTNKPTAHPTDSPTASPTRSPTAKPTAEPTDSPTASPTAKPTAEPTDSPTASPTRQPTDSPTASPTRSPTAKPTAEPTDSPTASPTAKPTAEPTDSPTAKPTAEPTHSPTTSPTTKSPTVLTCPKTVVTCSNGESRFPDPLQNCAIPACPTSSPTAKPTAEPTDSPTKSPTDSTLPTGTATAQGSCSFEEGKIGGGNFGAYCNMWSDLTKFPWKRWSGRTPSAATGPLAAKSGKFYVYFETSSPRRKGDTAILGTTPLFIPKGTLLTFAYHMFGRSMGKLAVIVGSQEVWSEEGDQGDEWKTAEVDLRSRGGQTISIQIVATRGSNWQSDIAIDDVAFVPAGVCEKKDVFSCPNGESIGRDPLLNCDFPACPTESPTVAPTDAPTPTPAPTSAASLYTDIGAGACGPRGALTGGQWCSLEKCAELCESEQTHVDGEPGCTSFTFRNNPTSTSCCGRHSGSIPQKIFDQGQIFSSQGYRCHVRKVLPVR
jgi:hypothetical protein